MRACDLYGPRRAEDRQHEGVGHGGLGDRPTSTSTSTRAPPKASPRSNRRPEPAGEAIRSRRPDPRPPSALRLVDRWPPMCLERNGRDPVRVSMSVPDGGARQQQREHGHRDHGGSHHRPRCHRDHGRRRGDQEEHRCRSCCAVHAQAGSEPHDERHQHQVEKKGQHGTSPRDGVRCRRLGAAPARAMDPRRHVVNNTRQPVTRAEDKNPTPGSRAIIVADSAAAPPSR